VGIKSYLNKKIAKYSIKGSVLLLALFVLLFTFTIIIILYLINKRYLIYAKSERTNYKEVYSQKKKDILEYLIKKSIQEYYNAQIIYNQENLNNIYSTKETFYNPIKLNGTISNLYMLYQLYFTSNSTTSIYYIDFNLYGYDTATTIYATSKNVDLSNYLIYENNNFKFKDFISKNSLNPLEKELIKKIIDTNKQQIQLTFGDLGTVTFQNSKYIYEIDYGNPNSSNLSITRNIKNIIIYFYVNDTPYKLLIGNTTIKTNISNEIDINTTIDSSNNTIVYPYMNTYIKSTVIKSTNAQIIKL